MEAPGCCAPLSWQQLELESVSDSGKSRLAGSDSEDEGEPEKELGLREAYLQLLRVIRLPAVGPGFREA